MICKLMKGAGSDCQATKQSSWSAWPGRRTMYFHTRPRLLKQGTIDYSGTPRRRKTVIRLRSVKNSCISTIPGC